MSDNLHILVGVPSGGTISEGSSKASWLASLKHQVTRLPSCHSNGNLNALWSQALNAGMTKQITHLAFVYADIAVVEEEEGLRWGDILIEEMAKTNAVFISVPVAIKDHRLLTSSGIGNPKTVWNPWRRFTVKELNDFPITFSAHDLGYGDKYLLHNNHLCMWDLRDPRWYLTDCYDSSHFVFQFSEDVRLVDGMFKRFQDSEDWAMSRAMWMHGIPTVLTRRVKVIHSASWGLPNWGDGGTYEHDEDTAANWRDGVNGKTHEPARVAR